MVSPAAGGKGYAVPGPHGGPGANAGHKGRSYFLKVSKSRMVRGSSIWWKGQMLSGFW